jgi:multiple sugar transport system permease protein
MSLVDQGTALAERPVVAARRRLRVNEEVVMGYAFMLPIILVLVVLVAYPFATALWMSLHNKMIGFPIAKFIGLDNYGKVLSDPLYWKSLGNTVVFTLASVGLKLPIGLGVALLIDQRVVARGFVRGVVLLPWAMPALVAVLIWGWFYNDLFGLFNYILMQLHITSEPLYFLGTAQLAMPSVIAVNVWRGFPFFAITLLAGLQGVSSELYEAGQVDGASALARFWHITVPGISTVMAVVTLLSAIWTFNDFMIIFSLPRGGPADSTMVLSVLTYQTAFIGAEIGKGTAIPVTMMPILGILIVLLTRAISRQEGR